MHILFSMHNPSDMHASILLCGNFDPCARRLPSVRERGSKGKSCFSKIIESTPPLLFLFASCCKVPLTLGKRSRISETLSGFPPTFPSKTRPFCQTFSGRPAQTFGCVLGSPFGNMVEGTWCCLHILLSEFLLRRIPCRWSAATRLILPTLGTMFFPLLEPCSNSIAVHVI